MSKPLPDPVSVASFAAAAGLPLADAAAAERIAAGAQAAIAAVRSKVSWPLIDLEPGDYLATLERLADPS